MTDVIKFVFQVQRDAFKDVPDENLMEVLARSLMPEWMAMVRELTAQEKELREEEREREYERNGKPNGAKDE
jgi:hypothetical protein